MERPEAHNRIRPGQLQNRLAILSRDRKVLLLRSVSSVVAFQLSLFNRPHNSTNLEASRRHFVERDPVGI
jgi:hypothetical protein